MSTWIEKLKGQKGLLIIIVFALIGILLLALSSGKTAAPENNDENIKDYDTDDIRIELETRVADLIGKMEGISGVSVMLTLDCGNEIVYARNGSENGGTQYIIIDGKNGDSCVQVKIVEPKLRGAAVICSGGNDAEVKMRIISLLSALFGLASNRIYVSG